MRKIFFVLLIGLCCLLVVGMSAKTFRTVVVTSSATAKNPLPLLGCADTMGALTTIAGVNLIAGTLDTFVAAVLNWDSTLAEGYKIRTAGGYTYRVREILGDSALLINGAATASESKVRYQAYEVPKTDRIILQHWAAAADTFYVGRRGYDSTGWIPLISGTATTPIILQVDEATTDLWFRANTASKKLHVTLESNPGY